MATTIATIVLAAANALASVAYHQTGRPKVSPACGAVDGAACGAVDGGGMPVEESGERLGAASDSRNRLASVTSGVVASLITVLILVHAHRG